MLKNMKSEQNSSLSMVKPILFGVAFGLVVIFALLIVFALIMMNRNIPLPVVSTLTVAASAFGGLAGGFVSGKMIHRNGILYGVICGVALSVLIAISGSIAFGLQMQAYSLMKFIAIIAASVIGCIFGVNSRK